MRSSLKFLVLLALVVLCASCASWLDNGGIRVEPPAPAGPSATLAGSLHGTAGGMEWWYNQPDGAGALFGVPYADTGCGSCHIETCDQCHVNADGTGGVSEPDSCLACHGRIGKETALGVTDVHFEAGMVCSQCHSQHEMHGDGNTYNSMLEHGAMDTSCENCHSKGGSATSIPDTAPHTVHGDAISCDACHMSSAVTCYNCHFETLLTSHEKKAAAAFKDFIFLLNDEDGKVRAGTYQSVTYDGKSFIAFGPFHGHSVTREGRGCADCHNNDLIQELNDTDMIQVSWWDDGEGKVMHTTGAIPFVPEKLGFQYLDFDGTSWSPLKTETDRLQYEFCSPLTPDQLEALGYGDATGPAATLPNSLHGTAGGMEWWYNQPDGIGNFIGVTYDEAGCGACHIETCDQCHANADGTGGVNEPDACGVCHGRIGKEAALGVTDLHFTAGMVCSDCHSVHEMHGDGNSYDSMLQDGAMDTRCENCHGTGASAVGVPDTPSHTVHTNLRCDACHMSSAVTCYNCHFETLLDSHEKKAAGAFKDFILLLNDKDGMVRAGTYQSVFYDNKGFVAFGPFHGHSVQKEGRLCNECHGNELMQELADTGEIIMTQWDAGEGKVKHATGVIPFVPDSYVFQFVDFDGANWGPVDPGAVQFQWEWCTPLTQDQLDILAPDSPAATMSNSLHGTAYGMQWWYEQPDGIGDFIGVTYDEAGCGACHVSTCDQCHANPDGTGAVDEPGKCLACHGRIGKETALGVTDVHFEAGMVCSQCHSQHEMHGDGTAYDSMLQDGAMDTDCETCHTNIGDGDPPYSPHTAHGDKLSCDACHMQSAVTCYNCHFQSLLDSHEKKAAGAYRDFILLLNDEDGKVRAGTYQSVYYDDKGFVAFGPFHGHSVTKDDARDCNDCHGNERMVELGLTGKIVMSWWDDVESKVMHTTGAIPFVPEAFVYQFVDFDGAAWSPVDPADVQFQWEWCSPLTQEQLNSIAISWPGDTLASSLHADAGGMEWWYNQPDGISSLISVTYEEAGCGQCHVDTTAADGGCSECHGAAEVHEPIPNQNDVCKGCHGRIVKEAALGYTDVHLEAGMECSECHLYDIHGDGNEYNSMWEPGAVRADCENCHQELNMSITEHTLHANDIHCDACHLETVITCNNCHFDSLVATHQKKAHKAFGGFMLLVNDHKTGKVRAGTYQSVVEDSGNNTFIAFGPFHGHTVTADGRNCSDCHNGDRMTELKDTGQIVMTQWDAGLPTPGLIHAQGVIPFVPDQFVWEFVDYDSGTDTWSPIGPALDLYQVEFCDPLTPDQLDALGAS